MSVLLIYFIIGLICALIEYWINRKIYANYTKLGNCILFVTTVVIWPFWIFHILGV